MNNIITKHLIIYLMLILFTDYCSLYFTVKNRINSLWLTLKKEVHVMEN